MKFNEFENLIEAFSQFKYKVPKDKREQLFDFYMLTGLKYPSDKNLQMSVDDALNTITTKLRKDMMDALLFAMTAEVRHMFINNSNEKIIKFFKKHRAEKFIKNYSVKYQLSIMNMDDFTEKFRNELTKRFRENSSSYVDSYKATLYAMKKSNMSEVKLVKLFEDAFSNLRWTGGYGGTAWANIAKGWQMLNKAKSREDKIIAIDHTYDLQHNTDTVFNKLKSYYRGGYDGYGWIKEALDKKFKIKNLLEIIDDISINLKSLAAAIIKDTENQTIEMFKRKQSGEFQAEPKEVKKSPKSKSERMDPDVVGMIMSELLITDDKWNIVNGRVDVKGDVVMNNRGFRKIPINFGKVSGHFLCRDNKLTSLDGAPRTVLGTFDCANNNLKTLRGGPVSCGSFNCSVNQLKSLEGGPKLVENYYNCFDNDLTSLKGAPLKINGRFFCSGNKLNSLDYCPKCSKISALDNKKDFSDEYLLSAQEGKFSKPNKQTDIQEDIMDWMIDMKLGYPYNINTDLTITLIGDCDLNDKGLKEIPFKFKKVMGYFDCSYNQLTSLKNCPDEIDGSFLCNDNKLKNLEHSPQKGKIYDFECFDNDLTSLKGAPPIVNGDFDCSNNNLETLKDGPEIVKRSYLCTNNKKKFEKWDVTKYTKVSDVIITDLYEGPAKVNQGGQTPSPQTDLKPFPDTDTPISWGKQGVGKSSISENKKEKKMKFKEFIEKLSEDYTGGGGNEGGMGSGDIVDKSVNDPNDPEAVYVPAKGMKKKKKKKKKGKK